MTLEQLDRNCRWRRVWGQFEKRWDERTEKAERDFLSRVDMAIARLSGDVLTKSIARSASGLRWLEFKSLDADKGIFTAYASTWHQDPDRQGDVIQRGAYRESILARPSIPLLWAHSATETIGRCSGFVEDNHGLKFEGEICKDVRRGREAIDLLRGGFVNSFSIGFGIDDYSYRGGDGARVLKRISLYEVSVVPVPADETARLI
jgi:HK97 family phage prohead protease